MSMNMLTHAELAALESLLARARRAAGDAHATSLDTITPGDVVQLRPGADPTWDTSLMIVGYVDTRQVRGAILTFHRSGCREAWGRYTHAEVARLGRLPYPEPAPDVRHWCYQPPCPLQLRKPPSAEGRQPAGPRQAQAVYRAHRAATSQQLAEELRRNAGAEPAIEPAP